MKGMAVRGKGKMATLCLDNKLTRRKTGGRGGKGIKGEGRGERRIVYAMVFRSVKCLSADKRGKR